MELKNEYTLEDFDEVVNHTCRTSEESKIHEDVFKYFREHPWKLLRHPRIKELNYRIPDIRKMLDVGLSGHISEFDQK